MEILRRLISGSSEISVVEIQVLNTAALPVENMSHHDGQFAGEGEPV